MKGLQDKNHNMCHIDILYETIHQKLGNLEKTEDVRQPAFVKKPTTRAVEMEFSK